MGRRGGAKIILLPPPAQTILLYAADGLSVWRGHLGPSGKPRTPGREIWVPMFRQLVDSDPGLTTLRDLARAGMTAWHCPPDLIRCLDDAFRDITFRALSIAALQDLADTAREKVVMPVSPRPAPPPRPEPPPRPRPGTPAPDRPASGPQRPRPRPGGRPPTP